MAQPAVKTVDTRVHLLETAMALIADSTYSSVGVAEICTAAGVTKGSFYHYFESKAALFEDACEHYWQEKKRHLDAIFSPEHDALARLNLWLDYVIREVAKKSREQASGTLMLCSSAQGSESEQVVRDAAIRIGDRIRKYNVALVKGLQDEGLIDQNADPDALGRRLSHYIQGLVLFAKLTQDIAAAETDLRTGVPRLLGVKIAALQKEL